MQRRDLWLFFMICVICLLVMLPRILSAQFGLLDDGLLLLNAQASLRDLKLILYQFEAAGRFLPTALSLRTLVFFFAGFEPQRWYLCSSVLLIIMCIELAYLVRRHGFDRMQAFLSVLIFVLSPTLIENFYTLSKSEIPLLLLISSAILLAMTYNSSKSRLKKMLIVVFCFLFLLFSFGAKETAIALPFLFLSWLVISWICFRKTGKYRDLIQSDAILLLGSLIGCVLYWLFRSILGIRDIAYSGGYELLNFEKLLFNSKALLGWLVRDYPYLLPALLAIFLIKPLRQAETLFFALRWFSWMAIWALILLPWYYSSYYLLPFSFGSAVFSGVILGQMIGLLFREARSNANADPKKSSSILGAVGRNRLFFLCGFSFMLMLPPACNATAYATEQLVFDQANWQMLEQVVKLPKNSRLLVNIPSHQEYFFQITLFVTYIFNRPDILIEAYQPPARLSYKQDTYLVSPVFFNQVLPRVRALNGVEVEEWGRCLEDITDSSAKVVSIRLERRLLDIGLHRLLFFLNNSDMIGFSGRSVIVNTSIIYGWDLWRLSPPDAMPVCRHGDKGGVLILPTLSEGIQSIVLRKDNASPSIVNIKGDRISYAIIAKRSNAKFIAMSRDAMELKDMRIPLTCADGFIGSYRTARLVKTAQRFMDPENLGEYKTESCNV